MSPTPGVTEIVTAEQPRPVYRPRPLELLPTPKIPPRCDVSDELAEALEKITRLATARADAHRAVQQATAELEQAPKAEIDEIAAALDAGKPAPPGKVQAAVDALAAAERYAAGADKALDQALTTTWSLIDAERPGMRRAIRAAAGERMAAAVKAHASYVAALAALGEDKLALRWASLDHATNAVGLTGDQVPPPPEPFEVDLDELEDAPPLPAPANGGRRRPAHIERALRAG